MSVWVVTYRRSDDTIDQNEAIEIYTYITNQLGDSICDFAKTNVALQ